MADALTDKVVELAHIAAKADGVAPFGEQPLLSLRRTATPASLTITTMSGPDLVGVALWPDDDPRSVEVAVHPDHRRRGVGAELVGRVLEQRPDARLWAHGKLPGAQAIAAGLGLDVVRELWRMEITLGETTKAPPIAHDGSPSIPLPKGFSARAFVPGQDEDAWLSINARAFVNHPEQGRMTGTDLDARMAESWFDPQGLILVVDDATGGIAASHWTKIPTDSPDTGEVYVVAVDPTYQGRGLARPLTALGLAHLAARAVRTVELYVEADNDPAVATYRRFGFEPVSIDAMYGRSDESE